MHGGHRTIEGQDLISGVDSYIYSLRNGAAAGGSCGQGWPTRVEAVGGREGRCRATPSEISGRPRQARLSNSTEGVMRVRRALAAAAAATCTRPPTARHWHQSLLYKPCCAAFPFPLPCAVPPSLSRGAAPPASARRGVLCLAWPPATDRPTEHQPSRAVRRGILREASNMAQPYLGPRSRTLLPAVLLPTSHPPIQRLDPGETWAERCFCCRIGTVQ